MIRIGSVYAGIEGLGIGLLAAFHEAGIPAHVAWQIEKDEFCTRVLAHHFPESLRYGDVAGVHHPPYVDVLCGGFVCTDVSSAGKQAGLGMETRSGFTLHHLLRLIDEVCPETVVIENVASGAKRWVLPVVGEMRRRGYRCRAVPLAAEDVGAPHLRKRIFLIATRGGRQFEWGASDYGEALDDESTATVADGDGERCTRERGDGILDGGSERGGDADGRGGEEPAASAVAHGDGPGLEERGEPSAREECAATLRGGGTRESA
ncbi:MAG: DNA cytosine methyltransferase, partial [Polyangiaceae bacterium]